MVRRITKKSKNAKDKKLKLPRIPGSGLAADLTASPLVQARKGLPIINRGVVERLIQWSKHKHDENRQHPFVVATVAPGVLPKGFKPNMAMDEAVNLSLQWAANAWSIWDEGLTFLGYPYLAQLTQRPEYRRPSEIIATEMTRKWIRLQSANVDEDDKKDKIDAITKDMERLHVRSMFKKLALYDGFFGRVHLFFDFAGSTDNREELKTSIGNGHDILTKMKVQKGSLMRLKVIEPVWTYPAYYNAADPLKPNWYHPEQWYVMGKEIHESRLLTFVGRELPDVMKPAYSFGGLSLSQMMKPYVDNWLRTRQSVSDIISRFSMNCLATDLSTLMGAQGSMLIDRVNLFNQIGSNAGTMILDKETEEWFNVAVPLGSLDLLCAQSQEQMAAPCGIPLVKLFGITPKGLNASSEGEIRVFYDWIKAYQEAFFRPGLTRTIELIQMNLFGEVDPDITFVFEELWSLDEKGMADVRKVEADTDAVLIQAAVISPEESRKRVASDPDEPYHALDVEDLPNPPDTDVDQDGDDDSDADGMFGGKVQKPSKSDGAEQKPQKAGKEQKQKEDA